MIRQTNSERDQRIGLLWSNEPVRKLAVKATDDGVERSSVGVRKNTRGFVLRTVVLPNELIRNVVEERRRK